MDPCGRDALLKGGVFDMSSNKSHPLKCYSQWSGWLIKWVSLFM
jgi:hypothetical protein